MKKLVIAALVIVLLVVVVLGVVFGFFYKNRNEYTRRATEKALEYVLSVDVDVEGADVNIGERRVTITGIEIDNPEGYDSDHAMRFGLVSVKADIGSFRTQKPIINEIRVEESDIIMEAKVGGKTNLQVLMDNAQRLASKEEPTPETEKKYLIEDVYVNATTVRVALPLSGGQTVGVQIPDIHMEDVGGDDDGATPAEAMREFIAVLLEKIQEMGKGIIPTDILNSIGGTLENLPADLKKNLDGILSGAGGTLENAGKSAEEAAKGVQDAIGGIFGKKQSDD